MDTTEIYVYTCMDIKEIELYCHFGRQCQFPKLVIDLLNVVIVEVWKFGFNQFRCLKLLKSE